MNKIFIFTIIASVLVASLAAHPLSEDGDDFAHQVSSHGLREKRAVSCASVFSQPRNPGSYYEACRAHCKLNGKKRGSRFRGCCSCF